LFNFFRHYKSPPFHTVIRIHRISFYGAKVNVIGLRVEKEKLCKIQSG